MFRRPSIMIPRYRLRLTVNNVQLVLLLLMIRRMRPKWRRWRTLILSGGRNLLVTIIPKLIRQWRFVGGRRGRRRRLPLTWLLVLRLKGRRFRRNRRRRLWFLPCRRPGLEVMPGCSSLWRRPGVPTLKTLIFWTRSKPRVVKFRSGRRRGRRRGWLRCLGFLPRNVTPGRCRWRVLVRR